MSEIDELWKIVQELAEDDPYVYNDNNGIMECLYCNDFYGFGPGAKHSKEHESVCLIARAQKLLEQGGCMRVEFVQCDVCEKKHDAQYKLPIDWITAIQRTVYDVEEEHHFCSKTCLIKWASEEVSRKR